MAKPAPPLPPPVTGWVGFGCTVAFAVPALFFAFMPTTVVGLIGVVIAAGALGLLTARLGERFYEKLLLALFRDH